jgi:hypothetical protein
MLGCGLDSYGSEQEPMTVSCEHRNKPSASIEGGKYLGYLSDCCLLTDSAALSDDVSM